MAPEREGQGAGADGVFGKIGEGGVAIDTVEDMMQLYDGFDLGSPNFSASMTISGPAPIIMAMYIAAAKRRFGPKVVPKLRGTIQADIFKEVQAQNETIFPIEPSLRFLVACPLVRLPMPDSGKGVVQTELDRRPLPLPASPHPCHGSMTRRGRHSQMPGTWTPIT